MKLRRTMIKVSFILIILTVIISLVRINMINSKTLSPLNNNYDNYDVDERELYDSYKNFITDSTFIKIYKENNGDLLIKLGDDSYRVKKNISLKEFGENIFDKIEEIF